MFELSKIKGYIFNFFRFPYSQYLVQNCEEANSNSNHDIHNNQTTQNQLLIINTQTNENEKTPTPKTKAIHIKSGGRKRGNG